MTGLADRSAALTRRWRVSVDEWLDTPTSCIGLGSRDGEPVVLKVVKTPGDEWNAGAIIAAFGGRCTVRALEHEPGAVLLERAVPGTTLVEAAQATYLDLCATQRAARLLHGDLQHYNVLFDHARGWVSIDPKGVVAEREFETGPFLRNPHGIPELYTRSAAVARRLTRICSAAQLDFDRAVRWAFAQAVLSAIWEVEDNGSVNIDSPALLLARATAPLVG